MAADARRQIAVEAGKHRDSPVFCNTNPVAAEHHASQLQKRGVTLLRNVFPTDSLTRLKEAATRCFDATETQTSIPEHYHFSPFSHSVVLTALADFGCNSEHLLSPLAAPGLEQLFSQTIGAKWTCKLEHSWVRKKFPPLKTPSPAYRLQNWHQDGALGVNFPPDPGPVVPITELLTCWIPLNSCGEDSPGLEFIHVPQPGAQPALLHFTELDDAALRRRFDSQKFHAPKLDFGDGLVFLNTVLHRTHALPEMSQYRLSVEYRIFPLRCTSR